MQVYLNVSVVKERSQAFSRKIQQLDLHVLASLMRKRDGFIGRKRIDRKIRRDILVNAGKDECFLVRNVKHPDALERAHNRCRFLQWSRFVRSLTHFRKYGAGKV